MKPGKRSAKPGINKKLSGFTDQIKSSADFAAGLFYFLIHFLQQYRNWMNYRKCVPDFVQIQEGYENHENQDIQLYGLEVKYYL